VFIENIDCRALPVDTGVAGRLGRIALFVAFTAVGAQLAVRLPFTPVPITVQTLFVVLAGITLGPRDGFYAMVSYLGLGLAGAPVFAGFSLGPAVLLGPTGGYLIAFPAGALVAGALSGTLGGGRFAVFAAAISGLALILAGGTLHLSLVTQLSLAGALSLGALPFAAGELVKALMAVGISGKR
jgi:biotin transport system substrate-specific component